MSDKIWHQIQAERFRQDDKWGGPAHDDTHDMRDWTNYLQKRVRMLGVPHAGARRVLIQIAALAVAAIESHDRVKEKADGIQPVHK